MSFRSLTDYFGRFGSFSPNARAYLIGTFLMGLGHGAVWVHLNLYYRELGLGEEAIGRLLSARSFGTVLMAIPAAFLIDRIRARYVFGISAVGFAFSILGQLSTPKLPLLSLYALLSGMAFTIHWATAAPFFMRNSNPEHRIYLFGFSHATETTATIVAALGIGWLSRTLTQVTGTELEGLRWSLVIAAIASLAALVPFVRIDDPPFEAKARRLKDHLLSRDWITLGKLIVPSSLVGLGAGLVIPFLNLYFRDRFDQNPLEIGGFFAVSQFFTVIGFLAGPAVARRFGMIPTVVLTEVLSIPFFLMLAFTQSLPVAVFAFWLRGALMNMNHPLLTNFAMEVVGADEQAVTNSMRMLAWNLSWMVSTQAGGWLIEKHGFTLPMLITISLYAVSSVVTYIFWRRHLLIGRST